MHKCQFHRWRGRDNNIKNLAIVSEMSELVSETGWMSKGSSKMYEITVTIFVVFAEATLSLESANVIERVGVALNVGIFAIAIRQNLHSRTSRSTSVTARRTILQQEVRNSENQSWAGVYPSRRVHLPPPPRMQLLMMGTDWSPFTTCHVQLHFIHQINLAWRQRRDLMVFESNCHRPTSLPHTA